MSHKFSRNVRLLPVHYIKLLNNIFKNIWFSNATQKVGSLRIKFPKKISVTKYRNISRNSIRSKLVFVIYSGYKYESRSEPPGTTRWHETADRWSSRYQECVRYAFL